MARRCFWGIGGGSDFHTAWLLSDPTDMVITSLGPILDGNVIQLAETIKKYTGQSYTTDRDVAHSPNPEYMCYKVVNSKNIWPLFIDSRRPNSYGVIVPPPEFTHEFDACAGVVQDLTSDYAIVAVDTGGDSLRGVLARMGDNDISSLFTNIRDTRDSDSIQVIQRVTGGDVTLYICGPGADGETTGASLVEAWGILSRNASSRCTLVSSGSMSEFMNRMKEIPAWFRAIPGSTIEHILLSLNSVSASTSIVRRNQLVSEVSAELLRSYWIVQVGIVRSGE